MISKSAQLVLTSLPPKETAFSYHLLDIVAEREGWERSIEPVQAEKLIFNDRVWYYRIGLTDGDCAVMYFHGGGLISGSANTAYSIAQKIAESSQMAVYVINYPLAPEYTYPTARDDMVSFFLWLRERYRKIYFAGDSSGCCLAMETCIALAEGKGIGPTAIVMLSPHLDLVLEKYQNDESEALDPLVCYADLKRCADLYLGGWDRRQSSVSPSFAQGRHFPPTRILVGSREMLIKDSVEFKTNNPESNIAISIYDEMWHVWVGWTELEEAKVAFEEVGEFLRTATDEVQRHSYSNGYMQ